MSKVKAKAKDLPKKALPVKARNFVFSYLCEWDACHQVFSDVQSITSHLSEHLYTYLHLQLNEQSSDSTAEFSFRCLWRECGAEISGTLTDFNRHAYFHLFHTQLKCQGQALISQRGLQPCLLDSQSRNWIPELPENLQCGWNHCQIIYDNPLLFYDHVKSHCDEYPKGNNSNSVCKWSGCNMVLKSKHKLREHVRSHSQEKVCACPTCGGLFASSTKLVDHLRRQADTDYHMYLCAHCNKKFATERLLRDHMRHHVNHYKCPFCDMTCSTPANLRLHIKYRHTNDRPFRCGHCSHSSKTAADLRKHLESHSEEDNFSCHMASCNYRTRTYCSLAHHFRKVHQEVDVSKYQCHVCQQNFTRGSRLTFHLKVKHKFKWPSGHSRFRYKLEEDGFYRLQTIRYESFEISYRVREDDDEGEDREGEEGEMEDEDGEAEVEEVEDKISTGDARTVKMEPLSFLPAEQLSPSNYANVQAMPPSSTGESTPCGAQFEQMGGSLLHIVYTDDSGVVTPVHLEEALTSNSENPTYNLQMLGDVALGGSKVMTSAFEKL